MTDTLKKVVLTATFTADQVSDVLAFWSTFLGEPAETVIAPYAQVYQQLLEPVSLLRQNRQGVNLLVVRWKDLAGATRDAPRGVYTGAARELAEAVLSFEHQVPLLVLFCPEDNREEDVVAANDVFRKAVAGNSSIYVKDGTESLRTYRVSVAYDHLTERTGKIPYTLEAMIALGTSAARWIDAVSRKPVKMFAVDCDNTLWGGVVGEDGVDGVTLSDAYLKLQNALVQQSEAGRVISLISKNEAADVEAVFVNRQEMLLSEGHIVSSCVNWEAKPANLAGAVEALNLGLSSVVFLDDSTVECGQMRAAHPDVTTVQVPAENAGLTEFTDHLWLFDQLHNTSEDLVRVQMYKEQAVREATKRSANTLEDFFASLELEVELTTPKASEIERFAQLTQRTNQFNASMQRLTAAELLRDQLARDCDLRIISAKDRFGDYGIIGAFRAVPEEDTLVADIFLLSCRAMGRGIEHQMVSELGNIAAARELETVLIEYEQGPRNSPAKQFLDYLVKEADATWQDPGVSVPARAAQSVEFIPGQGEKGTAAQDIAASAPRALQDTRQDKGALYQRIAHELTSAKAINRAMAAELRQRPDLATNYVGPSSELERIISGIWEEVIRVKPVGIHDLFLDLGGRSIQLVQIHALLQNKLQKQIEFTSLFEHGTVATLAKSLASASSETGLNVTARARKMRQARTRRANTMRKRRGELT